MSRAYYASDIEQFIKDSPSYILGELSTFHSFSLDELQRNAWLKQIEICKTIDQPYRVPILHLNSLFQGWAKEWMLSYFTRELSLF